MQLKLALNIFDCIRENYPTLIFCSTFQLILNILFFKYSNEKVVQDREIFSQVYC